MNLLEETKVAIVESHHSIEDVMFVGSSDGEYRLTFEEFAKVSDFEYDNGFGQQEIPPYIIVYFKDGSYLEREEYDGAEWWTWVPDRVFSEDDQYKKPDNLFDLWDK